MSNIFQPNAGSTILSVNSKTTNANNTTASLSLFSITGTIRILKLYGIVTTTLGANHTTAYFNLYDQTTRVAITLATGSTLSAFVAGSFVGKLGLAATAAKVQSNAAGAIIEPTTLETLDFSEFIAVKKTAAVTEVDYTYSTTDAPTSGVIQFFMEWSPLSADSAVALL
jgi:hypothetical protein